jgi:phosphoadenosine phosphosulfate reductase
MVEKISDALVKLTEIKEKNNYVSFSGGKDSLVTLDLALRVGISNVVFCDTTLEFEETLKYVETVEEYYGISITRIKAPKNFFDLVEDICVPSRKCRWCCKVFKFGPLTKFAIENKIENYITGLRSDESNKRKFYQPIDSNPLVPIPQINPIVNWNENEVWDYIYQEKLPINPLYQFFDRVGCWICPSRADSEWTTIRTQFPAKYKILENLLHSYAEKNNILDKKNFVENMKWTSWANPITKVSAGSYKEYLENGEKSVEIKFNADNANQITKVINLLSILTNKYSIIDNESLIYKKLKISTEDLDFNQVKQLNVLIEKSINCKGCGACLLLCPNKALKLDYNTLFVDESRCSKCGKCISSHILKGGCIIRNYSPKRASLVRMCA